MLFPTKRELKAEEGSHQFINNKDADRNSKATQCKTTLEERDFFMEMNHDVPS